MKSPHESDTVEITLSPQTAQGSEPTLTVTAEVDLAGLSHPGKRRANNEDHFLVARFGRFLETLDTNLVGGVSRRYVQEIGYGMLVSDGIGGHAAGEQASELAITELLDLVLTTPDWIFRTDDDQLLEEIIRRTKQRFAEVSSRVAARAYEDPNLKGLGATLTVGWSLGKDLLLAHVGDSRAYLFRRRTLHRLTRDHTLAQALLEQGVLNSDQAASHRLRHVLTQALGDVEGYGPPDVQKVALIDGDCLLLCSDGLTDMVADERIAAILAADIKAQSLCEELVAAALDAGGFDNITVTVARYRFPT